jgi:hypothetical protein
MAIKEKQRYTLIIDNQKVKCIYIGKINDFHEFKVVDKTSEIEYYLYRDIKDVVIKE